MSKISRKSGEVFLEKYLGQKFLVVVRTELFSLQIRILLITKRETINFQEGLKLFNFCSIPKIQRFDQRKMMYLYILEIYMIVKISCTKVELCELVKFSFFFLISANRCLKIQKFNILYGLNIKSFALAYSCIFFPLFRSDLSLNTFSFFHCIYIVSNL